ncbi:MRC2 protein, partial [Amia calva]|nr:MRC2 protein [Amia calva]
MLSEDALCLGLREGATSYYRKFHLVTSMATWSEAQQYCREKYSDLATANSLEEAVEVSEMAAANQYTWIGLHRGNWKWSNGNPMTFNKLTIVEAREPPCCGLVSSDGTWGKTSCLEQHSFLCYEETSEGLKKYIVVQQVKSWTEAQRYCRERHTDLVSVTSATEDQDVKIKAQGTVVWIGLFFEPWTWSDGAKFSLDYFNNIESYSLSEECACVSVYYSCGTRKWNDFSCNVKMPFICYEGLREGATINNRKFHLVNSPETWSEAQQYCRDKYTDLATAYTIEKAVEFSQITAINQYTWIGMYRGYFQWSNGLPVKFNKLTIVESREPPCCGVVTSDGTWKKTSCLEQHSFLCYEATSYYRTFYPVNSPVTWSEAQWYCREKYTDLATAYTIEEAVELSQMAKANYHTWTGLYRGDWQWSNGLPVKFNNLSIVGANEPPCCVLVTLDGTWMKTPCLEQHSFLCYEGKRHCTTVQGVLL